MQPHGGLSTLTESPPFPNIAMTEELKTCTKCGESKPRTEYYRRSKSKDGLTYDCKVCIRERVRQWAAANPERVLENVRRWEHTNPERAQELQRTRSRRWSMNNPEKRRATVRDCQRKRRHRNPAFRTTQNFRTRFNRWFKARGTEKDRRVLDAIGCTLEALIQHLEAQFQPGMSWDNWSRDGWHIDHIVPLASAGDDVDAMMKLWHYTNLQPLWATDNLRKGAKAA